MTIFRVTHQKNYTVVNNSICTDSRLSWKAKGIWLYAFSRPNDWQFNLADLQRQSTDKRESVSNGIKELVKFGYLIKIQGKSAVGKFQSNEYQFFEVSQNVDFPCTGKPLTDNTPLLSTKEKLNTELALGVCVSGTLKKKQKALEKYAFAQSFVADTCASYTLPQIEKACASLDHAMENTKLKNVYAFFQAALKQAWEAPKPCKTKKDIDEENNAILAERISKNRKLCLKVKEEYGLSSPHFCMGDICVHIKADKGYYPIAFNDKKFFELFSDAINKKFNIKGKFYE